MSSPRHAGLWHLLGEVEVVFGFWAMVLIVFMATQIGTSEALGYLESRNFTEPAFVFVIMVIAASRPVLDFAAAIAQCRFAVAAGAAQYRVLLHALSVGPLLGSFITEPAAMTLSALLLRDRYFARNAPSTFMYATVGVLFVNVSIGGVLTPYAAPPVLMVAERWGLDVAYMLTHFGWKAAIAVTDQRRRRRFPVPRLSARTAAACRASVVEARSAGVDHRRASRISRRRGRSSITISSCSSHCSCSFSASPRRTSDFSRR